MKFKNFIFKLIIFIAINLQLLNSTLMSQEVKIIVKIDNQIITNIDIENEYRYLTALNKQLQDLDKQKLLSSAKDSVIKELIKKNEIKKYYKLDWRANDNLESIIKTVYQRIGINNEEEFEKYLYQFDLTLITVYKKIEIEAAWNQLIYDKYRDKIKINEEQIKQKIKQNSQKQLAYNLSEILFSAANSTEFNQKYSKLKDSIDELGFDKTAYLYSESDSKNESGLVGWVNDNQLSDLIRNELDSLKKDDVTKPLDIPGAKIILKINQKKFQDKEISFADEYNKDVRFETDRQLNNFSIIYFNKIKDTLTYVQN